MIGHDAPAKITIANVRDLPPPSEWEPWVVYVGRVAPRKGLKASPLRNPYGISDYGLLVALRNYGSDIMRATQSRDARQKEYADVRAELARLRALAAEHGRLTLVCWCETWDGTGEAGEAKRRHWTPFRQTVQNLHRYVAEHPGCTMKEALTELQHHYQSTASCRSTLTRLLGLGMLNGLRGEKQGRIWHLFEAME